MKTENLNTLGELKASGYKSQPIKDELRNNLREKIKSGKPVFEGVHGFENTVIPELERAILSRHNINLLGLRGQAKTRLARKISTAHSPGLSCFCISCQVIFWLPVKLFCDTFSEISFSI